MKMRPILTYHRMIEAFNFAAAKVTFLTDPEFDSTINEVRNSNYSFTILFRGEGNISSSNRWAKSRKFKLWTEQPPGSGKCYKWFKNGKKWFNLQLIVQLYALISFFNSACDWQ